MILPNIKTAMTQAEAEALYELASGKVVLEVGSLLGFSTVVMAQSALEVHTIDPHRGYPADNPRPTLVPFFANLGQYGVLDKVVSHVGTYQQVLTMFKEGVFDFAFVDLSMTVDETKGAIVLAGFALRREGTLAVHDYGHPTWPAATTAVDDLLAVTRRDVRFVDSLAIIGPRP
jgi:predicted O-methyltransferase YrrM